MSKSYGTKGAAVSPHFMASELGASVLKEGGNAVEAAVAMSAMLSVVYPHMTGLGGDAFWLIQSANSSIPYFVDACGASGERIDRNFECHFDKKQGHRGPLAAITVAGAVSAWDLVLTLSESWKLKGHKALSLMSLLGPAIERAREGIAVSASQATLTQQFYHELSLDKHFSEHFLEDGLAPRVGSILTFPLLAETLLRIGTEGASSFYTGGLAQDIAQDFASCGIPLGLHDLAAHQALLGKSLCLQTSQGQFYNSPPPTQGISSLLILGIVIALIDLGYVDARKDEELIHAIVEATKHAFILRDSYIADPSHTAKEVFDWLEADFIHKIAKKIDLNKALPWPHEMKAGGDTVWFGAMDAWGNSVSCIQSLYHEFGSGVVLPKTGLIWHNRGLGFKHKETNHPNSLGPRKKPFHTLNPAMAKLQDGRFLSYGTMGGEGQPQTQAAIILRYLYQGWSEEQAVNAPRWLLGRSWGDISNSLKIEKNMEDKLITYLAAREHTIQLVNAANSLMGHAGLLVRDPQGRIFGSADMRSDGSICYL